MLRAALIPTLFAVLLASALPAFAQSEPAEPTPAESAPAEAAPAPASPSDRPGAEALDENLARWNRVLDRVGEQLQEKGLSLSVIGELDATVDRVREQVNESREPLQVEADRVGVLLQALGPLPKEGEPPETENVAAQRRDLNQLLGVPAGQLRKLDVLLQRTNLQKSAIAEAQGRVIRAQLLVKTPSLLSAETWGRAAAEFGAMGRRIVTSPKRWSESEEARDVIGKGYFLGALVAIAVAALLGWYVRRWLLRNFGRKPEIAEPSYRMRVLAALASATAYTVIPIMVVAVGYGALASRGLLVGTFQHLVIGIVAAVVWISALYGLPRAMLSPDMPHWRLVHMGDQAARLWFRRVLVFAALIGIDRLISEPFGALEPSILLQFTYAFIADTAITAVFLAVVLDRRLWRTPDEEAQAIAIKGGEPLGPPKEGFAVRSRWWHVGRALMGALALAIPVTALSGFGVLADHIADRLVATAGIFLVAMVLHGLARDLVAVFTRDDEKPPGPDEQANPIYVWSVLLLDIGLVVSIVFFMVPLWGGRWDNIIERIGWALEGFKIGGRTFSLTDVLMGIVVFIVLLVLLRFFQRFLDVRVLRQTRMDSGVRDALNTGIGYVIVIIAGLAAIDTAGIDLTGLAVIAGALSVGIGFGMQSVVNNFVSGLILLVERPIKVGDWIVVGQDEGNVKRISVRSTEIQTFSNSTVIVPNSELISGRVTNWMYKDSSGRAELAIGVAYGSDTAKVREVLIGCVKDREGVKAWPQPQVVFMDFGDSALLFQLRFHVRNIDQRLAIMSDVRFAIDAAFREAGISIPFPQRDIHVIEPGGKGEGAEAGETAASPSGKVLPMRSGRRRGESGEVEDGED